MGVRKALFHAWMVVLALAAQLAVGWVCGLLWIRTVEAAEGAFAFGVAFAFASPMLARWAVRITR